MNKINYVIRKNPLSTSEENRYMASINQKDTQWQDGVIEHMMKRNTTISKQDIVIVLDLMTETVVDLILNASKLLKKELDKNASIEKKETLIKEAALSRIYDYETRAFGMNFAAGSLIGLHGKNLIADGEDPDLFLKREETEEYFPMGKIMDVSERLVMCHLPEDVESGAYKIGFRRDVGRDRKEEMTYPEVVTIV